MTLAQRTTRVVDSTLCCAIAVGMAATAHGWLTAPAGTWRRAPHLGLFAGAFVALLAVAWLAGRWRRVRPLPATAVLGAAFAALTGQLGAVAAAAMFGWSAAVLGGLVLRRAPAASARDCTLVGVAVYGTVVGAVVQWPVHYVGTHVALLAAPLLCAPRAAAELARGVWRWLAAEPQHGARVALLPAALGAIVIVHAAVALMPELGHDALAMHLLLPARIASDHSWAFDVDRYVWTVMPALGDWIYTIGYVLAGEAGARLFNLGGVLLLARLVHDSARWAGGAGGGGQAAALLFLCTPLVLAESSSLFIDALWSSLLIGGALALFRVLARRSDDTGDAPATRANEPAVRQDLLIAGILLGGALAAKAVTFMALPVLGAAAALRWRGWLRRPLLGSAIAAGIAFCIVGCGPYLRAFVLTGNPVFPFFNGVFRSPHYPPSDFQPPELFGRGMSWDVLYRITFDSPRFLEARPGAGGFQWLLLVAPVGLAFAVARHRRGLLLLGTAAAVAWLTFRQTAYLRYVLPTFALAAGAVGAALGGALPIARATRVALAAATLAAIGLGLACLDTGGFTGGYKLRVLLDAQARTEHLDLAQPTRAAVRLVNELNTTRAPVAFFAPPLAAGLRADALFPNWYNWRFQNAVLNATSADTVGAILAREGAQYLILHEGWRDVAVRQHVTGASTLVKELGGGVAVRELRETYRFGTELLRDPDLGDPGAWQVAAGARLERTVGATVTGSAPVTQQVDAVPGRTHRLTARVRRAAVAVPADARLQVNWLDARGSLIEVDLEVRACTEAAVSHSIDVVPPAGATTALVYATAHGEAPVVFERLSFRR